MTRSGPDSNDRLKALAEQYGFGIGAIRHLCEAVREGGGDMAVFDHPEFLGPGQWMRGGLIMITDPADRILRNRIDAACNALSRLLRESASDGCGSHRRIRADARAWDTTGNLRADWWPNGLGEPTAAGETDRLAYAYFDEPRQLAVRRGGDIAWYDTGEHRITGVACDPDGSNDALMMTSPHAEVPVAALERVPSDSGDQPASQARADRQGRVDILEAIERLGELHHKGVLTESEFAAKKQELLARL